MTDRTDPWRVAVVGAGRIADEHLRFLSSSGRCHVVAVCDRSTSLASVAAARFGIERTFASHDDMLATIAPEVVHVLTPAATHATIASDCLDAGAHVVVEKPAALSAAALDDLLARANAARRMVIEDHNYRFNRPFVLLEQAVHAGRYGDIKEIETTIVAPTDERSRYGDRNLPSDSHALPSGFVHEFITHLAYLTLRLLPVYESVETCWYSSAAGGPSRFDAFDARVAGGSSRALVHFGSSCSPRVNTVRVRGTRGSAECDLALGILQERVSRRVGAQLSPFVDALDGGRRSIVGSMRAIGSRLAGGSGFDGMNCFLERTYRALDRSSEPPVSPADMRGVARLVDAFVAARGPS